MTAAELEAEYEYRKAERLGLLCEDREPAPYELSLASSEALSAVAELELSERTTMITSNATYQASLIL